MLLCCPQVTQKETNWSLKNVLFSLWSFPASTRSSAAGKLAEKKSNEAN